jgi:nitric oxide reductase NorQ protein
MAWRLGRPLVTVACHDDLSASDLTGRWLVRDGETVWQDGPLTRAARVGAICYLDEVVEMRQDVVVVHRVTGIAKVGGPLGAVASGRHAPTTSGDRAFATA